MDTKTSHVIKQSLIDDKYVIKKEIYKCRELLHLFPPTATYNSGVWCKPYYNHYLTKTETATCFVAEFLLTDYIVRVTVNKLFEVEIKYAVMHILSLDILKTPLKVFDSYEKLHKYMESREQAGTLTPMRQICQFIENYIC